MSMNINKQSVTRLLVSLGLLFLASCSSDKKEGSLTNMDSAVYVTVAEPTGVAQHDLNISGQVEASQTVNISTRVMGIITLLKVKVGDHVNKDQLLVTISNQDILAKRAQTDAMISEAQAALNNAQKDFDRFTILYNQQSATAKELDNVTFQFHSAQARLESAKQMRNEVNVSLGFTNLTAPFAGIVTQKLADAGSMASPGMHILTIEQSGSYQVTASVPENIISQIHTGSDALVNIKSLNKTIHGQVTQVSSSSEYTGGQFIIKVGIPDNEKKGLYTGLYANISIPAKNTAVPGTGVETVLVPLSSIINKDQLTGLYTVGSDSTALLRWVRLGRTYGDRVEVLTGLSKNEPFIAHADGNLYNGIPVRIK
jgi:RND family efflux transporter MFP subunit